jgi:hypothetical protein
MDVGLKLEKIQNYQMIRVQELLIKYYSQLSVSEIKLAFELLLIGELDDYLPVNRHNEPDRNHYGEFSADYVTKVLNAYKKRKNAANANVNKAIGALPEPEMPDQEKQALNADFAKRCYQTFIDYKAKKEQPQWYFNRFIYQYLKKIGVECASMEVTNDDLIRARTEYLINRDTNNYEKTYIISLGDKFKDHKSIVSQAASVREIKAVKETFDLIIKNKINLKTLIESHESIEI